MKSTTSAVLWSLKTVAIIIIMVLCLLMASLWISLLRGGGGFFDVWMIFPGVAWLIRVSSHATSTSDVLLFYQGNVRNAWQGQKDHTTSFVFLREVSWHAPCTHFSVIHIFLTMLCALPSEMPSCRSYVSLLRLPRLIRAFSRYTFSSVGDILEVSDLPIIWNIIAADIESCAQYPREFLLSHLPHTSLPTGYCIISTGSTPCTRRNRITLRNSIFYHVFNRTGVSKPKVLAMRHAYGDLSLLYDHTDHLRVPCTWWNSRSHDAISRDTCCYLTYSLEQSHSWESNRFSASQIPRILWNPKHHYGSNKFPPPVLIRSHINLVHGPHPASWRSLVISSHPGLGLPSGGTFPSGFPPKPVYTYPLPYTWYLPRPSLSSRFCHPNNNWRGVQINKLLIM